MNPTGKKPISLFLVFSLMMLSVNLYAKERRGAKLIITTRDGQLIRGELIAVKENSLLILDTEGKDESIKIANMKMIRIVRKSSTALRIAGFTLGLAIGLNIGINVIESGKDEPELAGLGKAYLGMLLTPIFAAIGAAIGILPGELTKIKVKFQIEGMSDSEIQETLDKLRKKARIRDYR